MKLETVAIKDLVTDPNNARKHSKRNLKAIAGSLKLFGQQKPIVIDKDNVVLAGNGTLAAAKQLKWDEIKVVRTELANETAMAFALADNRTAELASWDETILAQQLESLDQIDFDLGDIGFKFELGEEKKEKTKRVVTCPNCGVAF